MPRLTITGCASSTGFVARAPNLHLHELSGPNLAARSVASAHWPSMTRAALSTVSAPCVALSQGLKHKFWADHRLALPPHYAVYYLAEVGCNQARNGSQRTSSRSSPARATSRPRSAAPLQLEVRVHPPDCRGGLRAVQGQECSGRRAFGRRAQPVAAPAPTPSPLLARRQIDKS